MRGSMLNLGPTEQAILHILWRDGAHTIAQLEEALAGRRLRVRRSTVTTIVHHLYLKGVITREPLNGCTFIYQAIAKERLLRTVVEQVLTNLDATPADRRRLAEALHAQ